MAIAARMPMIATTTSNSIRVKPFDFFCFILEPLLLIRPPFWMGRSEERRVGNHCWGRASAVQSARVRSRVGGGACDLRATVRKVTRRSDDDGVRIDDLPVR